MKLSVIMPVYNEEYTVLNITGAVINSLEKLSSISDWEIIIVDDGSKDNTREILSKQFTNHQKIRLHFQDKNQGKGAAITKGFSLSTGDVVLVQDADLEYDPNEYSVLLKPILANKADVVYGSRFKGDVSRVLYFWHMMGNTLLTTASNMFTNLNLTDMETCYKVFRGKIIRSMVLKSQRFGIEPEMTAKIAKLKKVRIYEVPISYYGRTYEEGKKIGWKDGVSAIWCIIKYNLLTSFSQSFTCSEKEILG